MILVDLNQVMISNLMGAIGSKKNVAIEEDLVRHMVLNALRGYKAKFSDKYGQLILCCDDKHYWRRDIFPYYKASRKKDRNSSGFDWHAIFDTIRIVKEEIKENFPYKVIQIPHAEADDVIGSICHAHGVIKPNGVIPQDILILSGDKDFVQLQKYANVEQYSPIQKKFIRISNPAAFICEHILKGDRGDGVPNFLSADNTFVTEGRQKPLTSKKLNAWILMQPSEFCNEEMMRGYKRNQQLVDLDFIPKDIQEQTLKMLEDQQPPSGKLMNYFMKHRLRGLMDNIGDF
jgi:hypothetical protein